MAIEMKGVAGFDFDGTLVKPREGRRFPKDRADWRWARWGVPARIRDLATEGWTIMIITDQTKDWKGDMIQDVITALGVQVTLLVQRTTKKPDTSLVLAGGVVPSFYVGDAAGRPGDWSDCDKQFAQNLGVPFHTPEEFFASEPQRRRIVQRGAENEVLVMVGYPASGKSTLARTLEAESGYIRVDGDEMPTATAMVRYAKRYPGRAIIFDSTGGTVARRAQFIDWAKSEGRPVRIVWVTTDIDTAMDWNALRSNPIPAVAYYTYRKHFEPPTDAEAPVVVLA
jgi:bifunctional polynucleotide phosphatase/kinase